jgi:hypothetical protein
MAMDDPLRRPGTGGTDLPPVPPAAPPTPTTVNPDLTGVARSRHVMQERLTGPDGEPIESDPLTAGPSGPVLASQIKAVDDRHKRAGNIFTGSLAVLSLFILLLAIWLWHEQGRIDDLAAQNAKNIQTQVDQRIFLCRQASFLLGLNTTTAQAAWGGSTSSYDVARSAIRQSAVQQQCPGV